METDSCDAVLRNVTQAKKKKRSNSSSSSSSNEIPRRYIVISETEKQERADEERASRSVDVVNDDDKKISGVIKKKRKKRDDDDDDDDDNDVIVLDSMLLPFTALDLLREIWTADFTPERNIRLMLAAVKSKQRRMNNVAKKCWNGQRKKEVAFIIKMLQHLQESWFNKADISCTVGDVFKMIYESVPKMQFNAIYDCGFLSEEGLQYWTSYYKEYVAQLVGNMMEQAAVADDGKGPNNESASGDKMGKEENKASAKRGLNGLFDESFTDNMRDVVRQFITRLEDKHLMTVKSPGEIGTEIVRIQIYNTKDIVNREPRNWWRYAKLRAQFISSESFCKKLFLRRLLDQVEDELSAVPGIMRDNQ